MLFARIIAIVSLLLIGPSPISAQMKMDSILDTIIKTKELKVGISPGYIPFVAEGAAAVDMKRLIKGTLDNKDKNLAGFDIELAFHLAKSLGAKLTLVKANGLKDLQNKLQQGTIHIALSGITRTLPRAQHFYFSDPYFISGLIILIPKESPLAHLSELNHSNIRILVKPDSTSEVFARQQLPKATLVPILDEEEFAKTLTSQKIPAIIDSVKAQSFKIQGLIGKNFKRLENRRFTDEYFAFLLPRDITLTRYVDLFINHFKRSGEFHELAAKFNPWFKSEE